MSLFKAKDWWSSGGALEEDVANLLHSSLKIVQLGPEGSGDVIIYGSPDGVIQIFKPQGNYQPTDVLLEFMTELPILQVDSGKFLTGSNAHHIAVLHPKILSVYSFITKEGHADYGDQNMLLKQYQHVLPRAAYCFIVGQFGGVKNRDFICVQSLDGMLMFYEQEIATFSCFLPKVLIPGPLAYSHCADAFITCTSNWTMEVYSYYNLSQISGHKNEKGNSNKKIIPNWEYNVGENIIDIQMLQVNNNTCCFMLLGEKCLYCLHDNGIMKFMRKFDFIPVCFHSFLIGWYYENNARLMTMVVSDTSALLIYENVNLLWSCQLTFMPVLIRRAFFPNLSGALVALTDCGEVKCCYLGTEPELFTAPPLPNNDIDFEQAQEELEKLQGIIDGHHNINERNLLNKATERELSLQIFVNHKLELNDFPNDVLMSENATYELYKCKVTARLKPLDKKSIDALQVMFETHEPLVCTNKNEVIANVESEIIVETWVYLSDSLPISNTSISVIVLFVNNTGNTHIIQKEDQLPFKLVCFPVTPVKESIYRITLSSEHSVVDLMDVFKEFGNETFEALGSTSSVVAFSSPCYIESVATIISAKSTERYRIQSDNLSLLNIILQQLIDRITVFYNKKNISSHQEKISNKLSGEISKDILKNILHVIENHSFTRQELMKTEDSLDVLTSQFILIQKKLMIKYRERAPASCDEIVFLLHDTHEKIVQKVNKIQELQKDIYRYSCEVGNIANFIVTILKISGTRKDELDNVKSAILHANIYEYQNWEETMIHNVLYLLRTFYIKNEKDRDKLLSFDHSKPFYDYDVKRLIKYMNIFLNYIFKKQDKSNEDKISELENVTDSQNQLKSFDEESEVNINNEENAFRIPEGSMFGYRKPLLTARHEKQRTE